MKNEKGRIHFFYPWQVYLTWFYFYLWPSRRKRGSIDVISRKKNDNKSEQSIKLLFFGDLMATKSGKAPELHPELKAHAMNSDFIIGNCEFPLTHKEKGKHLFLFQMSRQFLIDFMFQLGVKSEKLILSIANNHIGDQGVSGFQDTLGVLKDLGIKVIGLFNKELFPNSSLTIIEKNNMRIGFIAWSEWLNWRIFSEENGILRKTEFLKMNFADLKKKNHLDFLIVTPHWEFEFQHYPHKQNIDLAQWLLKNGVDLIVGHHPHVLQPGINVEDKYCFFSLGNFNGPDFPIVSWPIKLGALLEVELSICTRVDNLNNKYWDENRERNGKLGLNYRVLPTYQNISDEKTTIVPLESLNDHLKVKNRFNEIFF